MKTFVLANERWIAVSATCFATVIALTFYGARGGLGMLTGILGGGINIGLLWGVTNVLGSSIKGVQSVRPGTVILVATFLLKLPILILLGMIMRKVGGPTLPCFVAGLGMVYFAAVGWGCAHS